LGRGAALRQGQRKGDFLAGKYLLEDCLGIGGMGEVYRATNVSLGRQVAIKLLSPEFVHIEEDVLRFLREARAAAAVRHVNVVDVLDVARDDDGTPFIVQELLAGEDLEHYLTSRNGRLSFREALEIMIPVADAVAAAHAQDVVHRDLKPANIFLARDRNKITPKVLDFGACLFPTIAERSAKEIRMLIGTPHYMAPEQIVSKQDVDTRSDVWAIGVILFELIVGETPFEAETANAVLELVKTRDVPPLRSRAKDAPQPLEDLIARCTKRDRLARYRDAGEVHQRMVDIRKLLRGAPVSSRMETLMEAPATLSPASVRALESADWNEGDLSPPRPPAAIPKAPSLDRAMVPSLDRAMVPSLDRAMVPSLDQPAAAKPKRPALLTLSSPGSEPPPTLDDLDIPLPSLDSSPSSAIHAVPPAAAQRAVPRAPAASPARALLDPSGVGEIAPEDSGPIGSLDLASRPSSWPPAKTQSDAPKGGPPSSIPPILDPRAVGKLPSPIPQAPLPREALREEPVPISQPGGPASSPKPRPPAVVAKPVSKGAEHATWTSGATLKFAAAITVPALIAFAVVVAVPAIGAPVGRALRGDSMVASGVLAVVALVSAAALCARSMLGERSRWLYLAAAGNVLFGIVMIIVTFAASEAAELGVPHTMGALSSFVAPIAPLALALGAIARSRAAWLGPYSRGEAIRFAAIASAMLFLTLALSPLGAVRAPSHAPQAPRATSGG
jgi:eukaryotic-like serine/threonine-protein kinase